MDSRPTLYIIWAALLSSAVIYGVVGYVAGPTGPAPEGALLIAQICGLFAMLNIGASYIVRPMLAKGAPFQTYMIVRWAMCESAAIMGLVVRFMGASLELMGGFIAATVVAMLIAQPNQGEEQTYEEFRKRP